MAIAKNRLRALLVLIMLVGPLSFYFIIRQTGKTHYVPLPYFGEKTGK
jgi:hypothetical protein